MSRTTLATLAIAAMSFALPGIAQAQDAAESATIVGTGAIQQDGMRQLGNAISGAMSEVGEELRRSRQGNGDAQGFPSPRGRSGPGASTAYFPMPGPVEADALAHAQVATYRLENGVIMRISGVFHPSPETVCEAFCDAAL